MNFEGFSISTDKSKLDLEMICTFLSSAYWQIQTYVAPQAIRSLW
jgi:hypothetical protein